MIDPLRPEISARYNPFWAPEGNAEEHVGFVFESFNMEKDFFEGHQRVYLENIARVLPTPASASTSTMFWSVHTTKHYSKPR